ncbi:response regulator [Marisediminicola sp. LYQ134]|uniref:response regulator n=1 Tax=unclassified Marisediminicola TaxID=2618316 RepID=UPI0039837E2E
MIRIMIVEDQDIVRTGLATILGSPEDFDVVAQHSDGLAALANLTCARPDVVIMDIQMPGVDGVEVTRRMMAMSVDWSFRILVLTTFERDDNVVNALRAGAEGFLGKGAAPTEIIDAVRSVAAGGHALSVTALETVIGHVAHERRAPADPDMVHRFDALTARERQVVEALVHGLDGDAIARRFFVSPFTVKTHLNRSMTKVGARDRAQLVTFAVRAGIHP